MHKEWTLKLSSKGHLCLKRGELEEACREHPIVIEATLSKTDAVRLGCQSTERSELRFIHTDYRIVVPNLIVLGRCGWTFAVAEGSQCLRIMWVDADCGIQLHAGGAVECCCGGGSGWQRQQA